jgi:hypothetical protein
MERKVDSIECALKELTELEKSITGESVDSVDILTQKM